MLIIPNPPVNHLKTYIPLTTNKIQRCKIIKSQINSELLKNYTKNALVLGGRFSIFAAESRKSAKFSGHTTPDDPQNDPKTTVLEAPRQKKYNFILLIISKIRKKCRKKIKKVPNSDVWYEKKSIFALPNDDDMRRTK